MKNCRIFGVLLVLLVITTACQKTPFLVFNGSKSIMFQSDGGSETIIFSCNRPWTIASSKDWLTLSSTKGDANEDGERVVISCLPNTTYSPRNATITVMSEGLSESVSIYQETNYGLIISPTTMELSNAEQDFEINVQKNVLYSVAIDNDCSDWISLGGTKALTTDDVTFHVAANNSYDTREGKIVFKRIDGDLSQTVIVRQKPVEGLFVSPTEFKLDHTEQVIKIEIEQNVEYAVIIPDDAKTWIRNMEDNQTKSLLKDVVSLLVVQNTDFTSREAIITIKQIDGILKETVKVSQAGKEQEITVNPFWKTYNLHHPESKNTGADDARVMHTSSYIHPQTGYSGDYFINYTYMRDAEDGLWHNFVGDIKTPNYWPIGGALDILAISAMSDLSTLLLWDSAHNVSLYAKTIPFSQDDILFSSVSSRKVGEQPTVDMKFNHAQAWVQLQLNADKENNITIKKVELEDAYNQGEFIVYNYYGNATASWNFRGETKKNLVMTDTYGVYGSPLKVIDESRIGLEGDTIGYLDMLIPEQPQTAIIITYTQAGWDNVLTYRYDLAHENWLMGKQYIYKILFGTNEITVKKPIVVDL